MKLKILIPGKGTLDLYENTRVPIRLRNPMFHDTGSHSFSFSAPPTDNNKRLFDHSDRVSRQKSSIDIFPFIAYFNNTLLFRGTIKSTYTKNGKFNLYLQIQEAAIYSAIHNIALNKLDDKKELLDKDACHSAEYDDSDFRMGVFRNLKPGSGINGMYNVPSTIERFIYPTDNTSEPFSYEYPVPMYRVEFLLAKIAATAGYSIKSPLFDRFPELYELVVNTITSHNNHLYEVNYIDGIPEYKSKEFLKDLKNLFNIFFRVDDTRKELIIENVDYILTDDNIKEPSNMFINKVIRDEHNGYSMVMENEDADSLSEELRYITLFGEKKITTAMGTIPMTQDSITITDITFNMDSADAPSGSTPPFTLSPTLTVNVPDFDIASEDAKEINPRLLFHRGLQSGLNYNISTIRDSVGSVFTLTSFVQWAQDYMTGFYKYPYLTQGVEDANGAKIPEANIELRWEGDYGLLGHFWNDTIYWEQNRKVETEGIAYFTEKDLSNFDMLAKYVVQNTKYIISKMDFNLEANRITPAKLTAFRV